MPALRYRKRPVEIEAIRVSEVLEAARRNAWHELPDWFNVARAGRNVYFKSDEQLSIETLEGRMAAGTNDYLIRGVAGELYPCRGDIFHQTYQLVEGW